MSVCNVHEVNSISVKFKVHEAVNSRSCTKDKMTYEKCINWFPVFPELF